MVCVRKGQTIAEVLNHKRRKENHQPGTISKGGQLGKHPLIIIHAQKSRALDFIGHYAPK
jgi:hypothetical protein